MDDPSQSANQAAGRQDRAAQEKYRAQLQKGSMTGLAERNTKWDVEYEGKDASGTLVRPFEPGYGDARALPGKMLGETTAMAVARGMGRNMPHSGAGDGTKVFKTKDDPALLAKMKKEKQEAHAPPPLVRKQSNIEKSAEQQARLEDQWSVGIYGGSYHMHTRHVTTPPPAYRNEKEMKKAPPTPSLGWQTEPGPPSPTRSPYVANALIAYDQRTGSYTAGGGACVRSDVYTASFSRESPFKSKRRTPGKPDVDSTVHSTVVALPRSRDKPLARNQGAHAMLDRVGPNIASGPIPRDGFTSDAYEDLTRTRLHELGFSDVLGETGERPDEIANGIDHLDKLEHMGPSSKDKRFSAGFTGNEKLYTAKLAVGGQLDEYYDRQGSTGKHHAGDISGGNDNRQWNKGLFDHHGGLADSEWDQFAKGQ